MRGLLVKDFRLMLQRKRFFLFLLIIALFMSFSMQENMSMIVGYLTLLSVLFCVSTMSYDEYDNCYAFLLSLPVERKTYVREKYIYGLINGFGAWIISVLICTVSRIAQLQSLPTFSQITETLSFLLIGQLLLDLIIPLQLKYGMERGRMAMIAVIGSLSLLALFVVKIMAARGIPLDIYLDKAMTDANAGLLIAAAIAVLILLTTISILISQRIMEKKEF